MLRETWRVITTPKGFSTSARSATANKGQAPITIPARSTGGNNGQQPPISVELRSQALRDLRRKVWPHTALLMANRALFKEVRRPLQDPPGSRPQMVTSAQRRLTVKTKAPHQFLFPDSGARNLCNESLSDINLSELSLLSNEHARSIARRHHVRFILVNGRTPRPRSLCAMCNQPVGTNYLREFGTQLVYCDQNCYAAHCIGATLLLDNRAIAS
jgi:hypothetical protein